MTGHGQVVILGFNAFERQTLESYFRLAQQSGAAGRSAELTLTSDITAADLLLLDADDPGLVLGVIECGRIADCVLVGGSASRSGAAAWLPRPVDALQVARTLWNALQRRNHRDLAHQLVSSRPRDSASAHLRRQAAQQRDVHGFGSIEGFSNDVVAANFKLAAMLIISNDELEWQPLRALLDRLGYDVSIAHNSQVGLTMARQRPWRFVLLGAGLKAPSTYEACKSLTRQRAAHPAPIVVVLNAGAHATGLIRATFSGADACLDRSAPPSAWVSLLSQHDPVFERVFEPTAPMTL